MGPLADDRSHTHVDSEQERRWRLVLDPPGPAAWLMAVDETLACSVRRGNSPPVLRLYEWEQPSLSLGYAQQVGREVDLERCERLGVPVVRRITGGRGILHHRELTYAFSAPVHGGPFSRGIRDSYEQVSHALAHGISSLGIPCTFSSRRPGPDKNAPRDRSPVCFQTLSHAEISVDGRKLVGSAQRRWPEAFLQQGSIPLSIDIDLTHRVLRFPSDEDRERSLRTAAASMAGIHQFAPAVGTGELSAAIVSGFSAIFGITFLRSSLTEDEKALAARLLRQRYAHASWTMKR